MIQANGLIEISGIVAHSINSPILSGIRAVAVEILDKLGINYDVRFRPHASILKMGPIETKELIKTCNIEPSQETLQTMELRGLKNSNLGKEWKRMIQITDPVINESDWISWNMDVDMPEHYWNKDTCTNIYNVNGCKNECKEPDPVSEPIKGTTTVEQENLSSTKCMKTPPLQHYVNTLTDEQVSLVELIKHAFGNKSNISATDKQEIVNTIERHNDKERSIMNGVNKTLKKLIKKKDEISEIETIIIKKTTETNLTLTFIKNLPYSKEDSLLSLLKANEWSQCPICDEKYSEDIDFHLITHFGIRNLLEGLTPRLSEYRCNNSECLIQKGEFSWSGDLRLLFIMHRYKNCTHSARANLEAALNMVSLEDLAALEQSDLSECLTDTTLDFKTQNDANSTIGACGTVTSHSPTIHPPNKKFDSMLQPKQQDNTWCPSDTLKAGIHPFGLEPSVTTSMWGSHYQSTGSDNPQPEADTHRLQELHFETNDPTNIETSVTTATDFNEHGQEKQFVKAAEGSNNELISVDEKIEKT